MQPTPSIEYRVEEFAYCKHCGKKQVQSHGLTPVEYFFYKKYLDDGHVEIEGKYFDEKYLVCSECGNICELFSQDNIGLLKSDKIQSILNSNISQTEKNLLVMNNVKNNEESLLDLYNYYQYSGNNEKVQVYRSLLIDFYNKKFAQQEELHSVRMLIELHRRNAEFDKCLELIKKAKKISLPNVTNYNKSSIAKEIKAIEKEKKLCKAKNSQREQINTID